MKKDRKKQIVGKNKDARSNHGQDKMDQNQFEAVNCKIAKKDDEDNNSMSNRAGIILDALNDYRKWFSENDDSDKEKAKQIDDAIEFVQSI